MIMFLLFGWFPHIRAGNGLMAEAWPRKRMRFVLLNCKQAEQPRLYGGEHEGVLNPITLKKLDTDQAQ